MLTFKNLAYCLAGTALTSSRPLELSDLTLKQQTRPAAKPTAQAKPATQVHVQCTKYSLLAMFSLFSWLGTWSQARAFTIPPLVYCVLLMFTLSKQFILRLVQPIRCGKLLLTSLLLILSLQSMITSAFGALAVIDARLLAESMKQRSLAVKQWAHDNDQQLQQINQLIKGNDQMLITYNLMDKNYQMNDLGSWQDISRMQEQSLALLYASKSLWSEYGSAQKYYADSLKAQAWENCMSSQQCDFNRALQEINDLKLAQAQLAYQNAEEVSKQIEEQINTLQNMSLEGIHSTSLASTIDALTKINGSVAISMADLNQQVALLTRVISQNLAKQSQTENLNKAYLKAITTHQDITEDRVNVQLED